MKGQASLAGDNSGDIAIKAPSLRRFGDGTANDAAENLSERHAKGMSCRSEAPVMHAITSGTPSAIVPGDGQRHLFQRVASPSSKAIGAGIVWPSSDHPNEYGVGIAAVVGGALAGILLTGLLIFGIWMASIRHRHPALLSKPGQSLTWAKPELGDTCRFEIDGATIDQPELEANAKAEMEARIERAELADRRSRHELWGDTGAVEMSPINQNHTEKG